MLYTHTFTTVFFWCCLSGLVLTALTKLYHELRHHLWNRAYNHGFTDGKEHSNDTAMLTWGSEHYYRSSRLRRAYMLGARHAMQARQVTHLTAEDWSRN